MSTTAPSTTEALRVLLARAIDYAGLFPPASLEMSACVANYADCLNAPQRWALGRFVLPASRLQEFAIAKENSCPRGATASSEPWHLTAILSSNYVSELAAVEQFNRTRGAVIDSIEARVSQPEEIESIRKHLPAGTTVFFEIAPERAGELLPLLRRDGGFAKLRTGGVVAEAIPSIEAVAGFVAQCAKLGLPFKATAGLHHPLRCMAPLTYEANAKRAVMHGFLNLFTTAAIAWSAQQHGESPAHEGLAPCLSDLQPASWHFGEDEMTWSGGAVPQRIALDTLNELRSKFMLSFGSCSFEEPLNELRGFGYL